MATADIFPISKSNIKVSKVKSVLGESTTDVGALCKSQKINMWSRHKPVHIANTPFPDRSSDWWRGSNLDCGIVARVVSLYTLIKGAQTADTLNGWVYKRPYGGAISPYRLADFGLYYHKAEPPINGWSCSTQATKGNNIIATLMVADDLATSFGQSLKLSDIISNGKLLSEWNLGIVVYDSDGNIKGRVVGTGTHCEFDTSHLTENKTYTAYPFLALNPMWQTESDIINGYITVPYCAPKSFKVATMEEYYGLVITVKGWDLGSTGGIRYLVSVTISKGRFNIHGGYIHLRFTTSSANSPLLKGEYSANIDAHTVTPTTPLEVDYTVPAYSLDMSRGYRLDVMLRTQAGVKNYSVQLFTEASSPEIPV